MKAVHDHPNLKPVLIRSKQDLVTLGGEMKTAALDKPLLKKEEYSKDAADLEKAQEANFNEYMRLSRYIAMRVDDVVHLVSMSLTYDKYMEQHRWHLSMCEQIPVEDRVEQIRIPDEPAKYIAENILFGKCDEIPNESVVIPAIRHFTRNAE